MKFTFVANVHGDIIPFDRAEYFNDISFFEGQEVLVVIKSVSHTTAQQIRGYRGIIIPQVLEAIEKEGLFRFPEEYTQREKKEVVHQFLKKRFLHTSVDTKIGEFEFEKSTADLNKSEVERYWEDIAKWFSETFFMELKMPEKEL